MSTGDANELETLRSHVTKLRTRLSEIETNSPRRKKDFWDKAGTLSTLFSGVLIALIGFYATNVYDQRQREAENARKEQELAVLQVQTMEKFIPHLSSGDESRKKAAIIAISSLGNRKLATKIALAFGGSGSIAALSSIASLPEPEVAEPAQEALGQLFSEIRPSVVRIQIGTSSAATGFFVSTDGLLVTAGHVGMHLEAGRFGIKMVDGTTVSASVVKVDQDRDLALLKAKISASVLPVNLSGTAASIGEQVVALGQSQTEEWVATVGKITAFDVDIGELGRGRIAARLKSYGGFSGAPVVDSNGSLVGLLQASQYQGDLTYLIPRSDILVAFRGEF